MSLIKNLERKYDGFEIHIPEWEIPDDGITALTGPSGSGKTSIVRILLGLEPCPSLSWQFGKEDLAKQPVGQRRLGVVFQEYSLFPHLTARENIEFAAQARNVEEAEFERKISEWDQHLKLKTFLDRKANLLSGGEQQRVALVRALIGRPRFLFLDEPFSALDADLRAESRKLVKTLVQLEKIPTLLISHDRSDVEALASQEFHLQEGRLI